MPQFPLFFFNEEGAQTGYVLIGPSGLREVAQKLLALADGVEWAMYMRIAMAPTTKRAALQATVFAGQFGTIDFASEQTTPGFYRPFLLA